MCINTGCFLPLLNFNLCCANLRGERLENKHVHKIWCNSFLMSEVNHVTLIDPQTAVTLMTLNNRLVTGSAE